MMRPLLFLLTLTVTLPVAAQVYSWKDENGRIHYSDTPPSGVDTKRVPGTRSAPTPATPASTQKTTAEKELEFRQRREAAAEAEAKAAKEKEIEDARMEACAQARNHLAALDSGERLREIDSKTGETTYLNDERRAAEKARVQKQIDTNCK